MSQTTDLIPIERLTTGVVIYRKGDEFGPFGAHAEVQTVEFDGEGYLVTALFMEGINDAEYAGTDEVVFWVRAGEAVEHGGAGAAILRQTSFVTAEEWAAKAEAVEAASDIIIGQINAVSGYECRHVDEAVLVGAVADALGVPALGVAAE